MAPRKGAWSIPFGLAGAAVCWGWYSCRPGAKAPSTHGDVPLGFLQRLGGSLGDSSAAFGGTRPLCSHVMARGTSQRLRNVRAPLYASLQHYSPAVLAGALRTLGYGNVPSSAPKSTLIQLTLDLGIPKQILNDALEQAQEEAKGARGGRKAKAGGANGAKSRRSNLWSCDVSELRAALNDLGVRGTASWSKRELVNAFLDIGQRVEEAEGGAEQGKSQQHSKKARSSDKHQQQGRKGGPVGKEKLRHSTLWSCHSGQLRAKLNSLGVEGTSQWSKKELVETLVGMGMAAEGVSSVGQRASQQKSKQKKKSPQQRGGASSRKPKERLEYAGQGFRPDSLEDELRWLENEGRRKRKGRASKKSRLEDEEDFSRFCFFDDDDDDDDPFGDADEDFGYEGEFMYYHDVDINDVDINDYINGYRAYSASATGPHFSHSSAPPPPLSPEKSMERALREKWSPENLSLAQAAQLLGVSGQPSSGELRAARKKLVHQWHPDRNPDRKDGTEALQLVLAAVAKLA